MYKQLAGLLSCKHPLFFMGKEKKKKKKDTFKEMEPEVKQEEERTSQWLSARQWDRRNPGTGSVSQPDFVIAFICF